MLYRNLIRKRVNKRPVVVIKNNNKPRGRISKIRSRARRSKELFLNGIDSILNSTFNRMTGPYLFVTLFTAVVLLTHNFSNSTGFIFDAIKNSQDPLSTYIKQNPQKLFGFLLAFQSFASVPSKFKLFSVILLSILTYTLPFVSYSEYTAGAFIITLAFSSLTRRSAKIILFMAAFMLYTFGFFRYNQQANQPPAK
uniref:Putative virion membrane protein n=1 Tax=Soybean thrips nege-like virus 2 TaxID=2801041 RepID=A0A7T8E834_9VIRU|nr:putative virion membrane protein [Soybean thrips nege-like virus 2]